jgi:hypothetical protein
MQQVQEDMITVHIECLTAISVVLTSNDKGHETTNIAQEEQQNAEAQVDNDNARKQATQYWRTP